MHPFRAAVESSDLSQVGTLLADDVTFLSPVVFKPYEGREVTAVLLTAVSEVFQDFHYVREIGADDAADHALVFRATVNGRELEGCDFLHTNADGLIDEFTVMVRPLSAAIALRDAMGAKLEAMQRALETGG
jgi:hypothetical protein